MAQLRDLVVTGDSRVVGNTYNNSPKVAFGTCSTAAATAAKVVDISDPTWNLQVGNIIGVKFTNNNSASSVTLNVNGSGAKSIAYSTSYPYTGNSGMITGYASNIVYYQYDGTYWEWVNCNYSTNSNTIPSAWCGTAAATQAKTASLDYYTATNNSYTHIDVRYANSYAGAITLNIDGKGAKPIYINGTASSSSNYTLPAGTYIIFYDGNNYYFRTDGKLTASITGDAATVSGGYTVAKNVPSDAKFTDTTYESKAAASGGTAVSLVTTGEKYTWNNKTSNTGTVTSIATGVGLVGGTITGSGTIKADLKSETKSSLEATAMGSTSGKQYAVGLDKNGDLSVNIPWTDNNTTYTFANGTNGFTVTPSGGSAQTVTVTPSITNNVTGSGTSGSIAKFNGTNTIADGPKFGSSQVSFLRNDGTWATPTSGIYVGNNEPTGDDCTTWIDTSTDIIDIVYPIGAVYFSVDFTNPGLIFGKGTWERLSPDPFENIRVWKRIA